MLFFIICCSKHIFNLKKNPQKEYILWPDRLAKVEAFEDHLQEIYKAYKKARFQPATFNNKREDAFVPVSYTHLRAHET